MSSPNKELPYDLMVSILARVSRLYYTKISLVSKSFRSLLASPELYQSRNLLGCTEAFLYVCLSFPDEGNNPHWFILYRTPQKNILAPTSVLNSPPYIDESYFVAVGYNIYAFRPRENEQFDAYRFLDCRTNTWREALRLILAHTNTCLDGKMYLPGISETPVSLHCVEWYNEMTRTRNLVPPQKRIWQPENLEGKIYVHKQGGSAALKLKNLTWEPVAGKWIRVAVLFVWRKSNSHGTVFETLMGLQGLPKFTRYSTVRLADCGGKLVVLWDKYVSASGYTKKMIWCAEISLEVRNNEEIWGKVEWVDAVLSVPKSYDFVGAIAATV